MITEAKRELYPFTSRVILETKDPEADATLIRIIQEKGFTVDQWLITNSLGDHPQFPQVIAAGNRYEGIRSVIIFIATNTPPEV